MTEILTISYKNKNANIENLLALIADAASTRLRQLLDRYVEWRVVDNPVYGTILGMCTYDDKLQQFTEEAFENTMANATYFLQEANIINEDQLNSKDKVTLQILKDGLQTYLDGYQYRKFSVYNPLSTVTNPISNTLKTVFKIMPTKNITHFENILARYRNVPTQFAQLIQLMRKAIQMGTTQHTAALTGVMDYMNSFIVTRAEDSVFYTKFANITDDIPADEKLRLQNEAQSIIMDIIMPAIRNLTSFVATEYSSATRPEPGLGSLPEGLKAYKQCLKYHTSLPLSPEEVHQTGLEEVSRIRAQMEDIMTKDGFSGSLQDYKQHLYNQTELFYENSEDFLEHIKGIMQFAHDKLPQLLKRVPKKKVIVVPAKNPSMTAGSYGYGVFWVSAFSPQTKPRFTTKALTLHEAEPGHHTMYSYLEESDLPLVQKTTGGRSTFWAAPFNWPWYTSYREGWGLYAEYLGEEMGIYSGQYDLLGRLSWEALRACRLVVDTGIHAFGWSKQRAIDYMNNNTMHSIDSITKQVNRYIGMPGQACAYKIGELAIHKFRKHAQNMLKTKFDLRDFHDQILSLGPCPLWVMEKQVNAWIEKTQKHNNSPNLNINISWYILLMFHTMYILF